MTGTRAVMRALPVGARFTDNTMSTYQVVEAEGLRRYRSLASTVQYSETAWRDDAEITIIEGGA